MDIPKFTGCGRDLSAGRNDKLYQNVEGKIDTN
jgi:hypothetical protein